MTRNVIGAVNFRALDELHATSPEKFQADRGRTTSFLHNYSRPPTPQAVEVFLR